MIELVEPQIDQRTPEWFQQRCGKVTASMIDCVMAKKTTKSYTRYQDQILAEIRTGTPQELKFINASMQWGIDHETEAREAYELEKIVSVEKIGFVQHPKIERAGASPDGLVDDGLLEIKCPDSSTHLRYLIQGKVPVDYQPQMLWQMACTGRPWCDFVSYDSRMVNDPKLFIMRFHRDDEKIQEMEKAVMSFLSEIDEMIKKLQGVRHD